MKFKNAKKYGVAGTQILIFYVRLADGKLHQAVTIRAKSRKELARVLLKFRKARNSLTCSSRYTFGGGFKIGSLRWIACHCGIIKDFTLKNGKMKKIIFKNRNMRATLSFVG